MRTSFKITGSDAVRLAERDHLEIFHRHNGGVSTVTVGEARQENLADVFVIVQKDGWWDGQRVSDMAGYSAHDYFSPDGTYLGPDDDGVEPTWSNA